jgi:hypothetical protein
MRKRAWKAIGDKAVLSKVDYNGEFGAESKG